MCVIQTVAELERLCHGLEGGGAVFHLGVVRVVKDAGDALVTVEERQLLLTGAGDALVAGAAVPGGCVVHHYVMRSHQPLHGGRAYRQKDRPGPRAVWNVRRELDVQAGAVGID